MPLIMGLMPVLPRHGFSEDVFESTSLSPPIGSGPYRVTQVDPGSHVVYTRNPDYWGKDLAINKGRFNFDQIKYEYYRDDGPMFQAFQKGLIQLWAGIGFGALGPWLQFSCVPGRTCREGGFPDLRAVRHVCTCLQHPPAAV